jgi:putative aldouronate transport system substrate-binding protein
MFGNQFNAYYVSPDQVGAWEETDKINKTAIRSVILGFSFNQDPVKTEIAQVQAASAEMEVPLMRGQLDPATALPEFQKKLTDAGIDKVLTEMQSQIDAWMKANKK